MPSMNEMVSLKINDGTPAIKINGQTLSMGEIDSRAMNFSRMMGGSDSDLTSPLRKQLQRQALQQIMREYALTKKASELGIEITSQQVENEFKKRFEKTEQDTSLDDLMKTFGVTREGMMKRVEKDLLENAVYESFISKLTIPEGEIPDTYKSDEFQKWIEDEMSKLDIEILSKEIEMIFKIRQPGTTQMPPHPMPGDETTEKEGNT